MLGQVGRHVLEVFDALPGRREGQFGGVELLLHIAGSQAHLEPAVGQLVQRGDVARQQSRLVEAGVEDERTQVQRIGRGRRGRQDRERCRRAQVVGDQKYVVTELFGQVSGVADLRRGGGVAQADTESEIVGHGAIVGPGAAGRPGVRTRIGPPRPIRRSAPRSGCTSRRHRGAHCAD